MHLCIYISVCYIHIYLKIYICVCYIYISTNVYKYLYLYIYTSMYLYIYISNLYIYMDNYRYLYQYQYQYLYLYLYQSIPTLYYTNLPHALQPVNMLHDSMCHSISQTRLLADFDLATRPMRPIPGFLVLRLETWQHPQWGQHWHSCWRFFLQGLQRRNLPVEWIRHLPPNPREWPWRRIQTHCQSLAPNMTIVSRKEWPLLQPYRCWQWAVCAKRAHLHGPSHTAQKALLAQLHWLQLSPRQ